MRYPRRTWRLLMVCMLLAGALSLPFPAQAGDPPATATFFGIQVRDLRAELATLPAAGAAGMAWVRMNLRWADVEPTQTNPPTYVWTHYDELLAATAAQGLAVILTVRDNPGWAATTACGPIDRVPASRFVAFLSALAARYGAPPYGVHHYELYNEPDNNHAELPEQGGCWGQHASEYAALLALAQPALKVADPSAQLVLGGIAYDLIEGIDDGGIFNKDFLVQLLDSPGGHSFDIMNFHYYKAFAARWNPFGRDVIGKANNIRSILAARGVSRPMIVTEIGDPSAGPASDGQSYSDAESRRYVVQAYARGLAAGLQTMVWFQMADAPGDLRKYGLLDLSYAPKPAYNAYRVLTAQLAGTRYLRTPSTPGLETYAFEIAGGEKWVSWSVDGAVYTLACPAGAIWAIDRFGSGRVVRDGSPGDVDGRSDGVTSIGVGFEPLFVYPYTPARLQVRTHLPLLRAGP